MSVAILCRTVGISYVTTKPASLAIVLNMSRTKVVLNNLPSYLTRVCSVNHTYSPISRAGITVVQIVRIWRMDRRAITPATALTQRKCVIPFPGHVSPDRPATSNHRFHLKVSDVTVWVSCWSKSKRERRGIGVICLLANAEGILVQIKMVFLASGSAVKV